MSDPSELLTGQYAALRLATQPLPGRGLVSLLRRQWQNPLHSHQRRGDQGELRTGSMHLERLTREYQR